MDFSGWRAGDPVRIEPVRIRAEDGAKLRILIEGPVSEPVAWRGRFERPLRIAGGQVAQPPGLAGIGVAHRVAAQTVEINIAAMPSSSDGVSAEDARRLFPTVRPNENPDISRVLIEFDTEH